MTKVEIFPELAADERSVLQRRGLCKLGPKGGWKGGRLFLTDKKLAFAHEGRFLLNVPYGRITDVRIKARLLSLKRRRVLALALEENGRPDSSRVWLAVNDVRSVAGWLCRMMESGHLPERQAK